MAHWKNKEEYQKWKTEKARQLSAPPQKPIEKPEEKAITQELEKNVVKEKKCKFCAMMIPREANVCPYCRKQLSTSTLTAVVLIFFIVVLFIGIFRGISDKSGSRSTPKVQTAENKKLQKDRAEYIAKIIQAGVIDRIDNSGSLPHVWVRPLFYTLSFQQKQTIVSVIFVHYYPGRPDSGLVVLNDYTNGKEIGKYSPVYGGLKLE